MQMELAGSSLQMHRKKESHQTEIVIAMQMANKDPVDLVNRNLIAK
jgi:hypothetical protein